MEHSSGFSVSQAETQVAADEPDELMEHNEYDEDCCMCISSVHFPAIGPWPASKGPARVRRIAPRHCIIERRTPFRKG